MPATKNPGAVDAARGATSNDASANRTVGAAGAQAAAATLLWDACRADAAASQARRENIARHVRAVATELGGSLCSPGRWRLRCPHCGAALFVIESERPPRVLFASDAATRCAGARAMAKTIERRLRAVLEAVSS